MNLGQDFNSSVPTDADLVRHPTMPGLPATIRHVRSRLKSFYDVAFSLESGTFKNSSIPQSAFVDHPDKPASGTTPYLDVTVDERGFVVAGSYTVKLTAPRFYRAFFAEDNGSVESEGNITKVTAQLTDNTGLNSNTFGFSGGSEPQPVFMGYNYEFTVPANVTKIVAAVHAGGSMSVGTVFQSRNIKVTPGEVFKVFVGAKGVPSIIYAATNFAKHLTSAGHQGYLTGSTPPSNATSNPWISTYRPFGLGDRGGWCLIEWYA